MLNHRQRGVSLLELMIGIAVGLLVVASSLVIYLNGARGGTDSLRANRFNQDVREIMNIMVNDIRRAGYWADAAAGTANPYMLDANNIRIVGSCILFSYDAVFDNAAVGVTNGADFFGYRLNGGTLQMLDNTVAAHNSTAATFCGNGGTWVNLTDPGEITVTGLTFSTAGSRCLTYNPATYDSANAATYPAPWTLPAGSTVSACDPTATGYPSPAPAATNVFIETREIQITLTAQHASEATYTRTINESVSVRNNRATP